MAVKGEVQNSVLPSLENITKTEVKLAVNNQIAKGLGDSMRNVRGVSLVLRCVLTSQLQTLPPEIEKMLLKPEICNQIARNLSNNLTPFIERYVKEAMTKTLIPAYQAQSSAMHQEISREIRNEIMSLKKEVISWQSEALRSQEVRSYRHFSTLSIIQILMPSLEHDPRHGAISQDLVRTNQIFDSQHRDSWPELKFERDGDAQLPRTGSVVVWSVTNEPPRSEYALDG